MAGEKAKTAAEQATAQQQRAAQQQPQQAQNPAALLAVAQLDFQNQLQQIQQQQAAQIAELHRLSAEQQEQAKKENEKARQLHELTAAFEKRAPVSLDQLPSLMVPASEAHLHQLAATYHLLHEWARTDNQAPFTLADLAAHTPLANEATTFVSRALGDTLSQWFPADAVPESVVPRQGALLLRDSTKRLSENWEAAEKAEEIAQTAAGSYAEMTDVTKKRRAMLLDTELIPTLPPTTQQQQQQQQQSA